MSGTDRAYDQGDLRGRRALAPWALLLAFAAGCQSEPPLQVEPLEPAEAYQLIADAVPAADFGFPAHPIHVETSSPGHAAPPSALELAVSEHRFQVFLDIYWPRFIDIPYAAVLEVERSRSEVEVLLDAGRIPGLSALIAADVDLLERLSPRVYSAVPFDNAHSVRRQLERHEERHGPGRLPLTFSCADRMTAARLVAAFELARGAAE
jgi:hypothetical protein